jgi:hypothetical protein
MGAWKKFFEVLSFVTVFAVPVILYLMEKAAVKLTWIFGVGWLSIGAAALYLVLNIPWVWADATTAMRVWRICLVCSGSLLLVGYGAIKIWPKDAIGEARAIEMPGGRPPVHEANPIITMTSYGSLPNSKMFAIVKVESPPPIDAPFHLLLICRVLDSTVDEMEDPRIEKSSLSPLTGQTIEMTVSQDFLKRAYALKFVHIILVLLPDGVDPNKISKLSDIPLLGGQIVINNGFVPTVYPIAKPKSAPSSTKAAKPAVAQPSTDSGGNVENHGTTDQVESNAQHHGTTDSVAPAVTPMLAHVRIAEQKQIVSTLTEFPYAWQVVIQTDKDIQPVAFFLKCDGQVGKGEFSFNGGGVFTQTKTGSIDDDPTTFGFEWKTPAFTPDTPIIVTLWSQSPLKVVSFEQMQYQWP